MGLCAWTPVLDDMSLRVDEELCKVPRDLASDLLLLIVKFTVAAEESVRRTSVRAVDVGLGEHGPLGAIVFLGVSFDLSVAAGFLVVELVAGECENIEASTSIPLMDFGHLSVVGFRQTSVRRHVDDQNGLFTGHKASEILNLVSIDVDGGNVAQTGVIGDDSLLPIFENEFGKSSSHQVLLSLIYL